MERMDKLQLLLIGMDVSVERRTDIGWLIRNLHFRNKDHPNFKEAMEIIRELWFGV